MGMQYLIREKPSSLLQQ